MRACGGGSLDAARAPAAQRSAGRAQRGALPGGPRDRQDLGAGEQGRGGIAPRMGGSERREGAHRAEAGNGERSGRPREVRVAQSRGGGPGSRQLKAREGRGAMLRMEQSPKVGGKVLPPPPPPCSRSGSPEEWGRVRRGGFQEAVEGGRDRSVQLACVAGCGRGRVPGGRRHGWESRLECGAGGVFFFGGCRLGGRSPEPGRGARIWGDAQVSWRKGNSGQRERAACRVGGFLWSRSEEKARDASGSSASGLQGAERDRPGKKEGVSNTIRWPTLSAAGPLSQLPRLGPPFYRRPTNSGFRTSPERNCRGVGARPGAEEGGSRKKGLFPGPCVLLGPC